MDMKSINFFNKAKQATFANMLNKVFFICVLLMAACKSNSSQQVDVKSFHSLLTTEKPQLLDCRSIQAYDSGHLPGALHIDPLQASKDAVFNTLYKEVPVYYYGTPSNCDALKKELSAKGFSNPVEITGGIAQWQAAQFEVQATPVAKLYPNDTIPFDKAIQGNQLVLVDFNATWCKPCRMMQPSIDKIREERSKEVIVYSIDIDQHPEYNQKYQIGNIPLVMMFKQGKQLHRSEGYLEETMLQNLVDVNK
jgi:thioredoxin